MKRLIVTTVVGLWAMFGYAQEKDSSDNVYTNSAENLLQKDNKLLIGGYGEVHYNQPLDGEVRSVGALDVHRLVMLFGYNFDSKTQFVSELEFEHVKEVYVEQAFLQHKLNQYINLRAGLLLVPMGIINEYHEPTTFNGVERPLVDKYIAPTTWREIGFGASGAFIPASLKYQAYIINGFNGYDGSARLSGKNGLRKGRQKGAESYVSSPNFTGKVEYYGLRGLNVGLSVYYGDTQSSLYDGISKSDDVAQSEADSSVVGVSMLGFDCRYSAYGFQLRGQLYYTQLSNTEQYNVYTSDDEGKLNDVGSSMVGYYAELAYNVLRNSESSKKLSPFVRYEYLNTHNSVDSNIEKNALYEKEIITTGISYTLSKGTVVKSDIQFMKSGLSDDYTKTLNVGVGIMF